METLIIWGDWKSNSPSICASQICVLSGKSVLKFSNSLLKEVMLFWIVSSSMLSVLPICKAEITAFSMLELIEAVTLLFPSALGIFISTMLLFSVEIDISENIVLLLSLQLFYLIFQQNII